VVKADANLYSEWYYGLKTVRKEEFKLYEEAGKNAKDGTVNFDFTDRSGKAHKVSVSYRAQRNAAGGTLSASIAYDGLPVPLSIECKKGGEAELAAQAGPLSLKASIDLRSSSYGAFAVLVERTDVEWGEWKQ
jgi:hypothetical protein